MEQTLKTVRKNLKNNRSLNADIDKDKWQKLLNRYSHFSDTFDNNGFVTSSEVVVTSLKTPRPCLHMMCSNHENEYNTWGSFWDQFCGGFSCVDSVLAGKMTSHLDTNYVPTAPEPQDFRGFYVYEEGKSWPMFPVPGFDEENYTNFSCRQGLDYEVISAEYNKLRCELTVFVHPDEPMELWKVRIENLGNKKRKLSWFSKVRVNIDSYPFYYFVPRVVCEGLYENESLVFLNHDKNNKHKRNAFFTSYPTFDRFDMMGEVFDGVTNRNTIPEVVQKGECTNSLGTQPYAGLVAGVQFDCELDAGESKEWSSAYGKLPYTKGERSSYLEKVKADIVSDFDGQFEKLSNRWNNKVSMQMVKTPCGELDRYYNIWSKYQGRNQARYCRALDKVGYRDVLQDLLSITDCEHEYIRKILLRTLEYQLADGSAVRQYEKFEGGGHDLRKYADSPSWIPDLLTKYIKESGDFDILNVEVPFFDDKTLGPDASNTATVYEHALRAVRSLANNTGYNGLCKIGYGDWNDSLSGIGGEKGVSVWLSCACVYGANLMAELADYLGNEKDKFEMQDIAESMSEKINDAAWDGKWYIYAINDAGERIGSNENIEGKIHLNVNTWALFTGIAGQAGRESDVWNSIEPLKTPVGVRLLAPGYTQQSRDQVGRIADQLPGMFENGSIYTHGEAFYLYALINEGKSNECFENLMKTLPSSLVQDISSCPRQQQSNFTVGPEHPQFGKQLFSNFSGSLPWYRKVIEKMLGVVADYDSLLIEPCVPSGWDEYSVMKIWRGKSLKVNLRRTNTVKVAVKLNNKELTDNRISFSMLESDELNLIEVRF